MTKSKKDEIIVSFPRMGNACIPMKAMFEGMGAKVLLPPKNNKETLSIGVRNSVETICLPYKLNLGNYIQALENGANVLVMMSAPGTCRLGTYAPMAEAKLKELGYEFKMIMFDIYKGKLIEIGNKFASASDTSPSLITVIKAIRLGIKKFEALDTIERKLLYSRPREYNRGESEIIYNKGITKIDRAKNLEDLDLAINSTLKEFQELDIDRNKEVLKIYLTGEFYVLLDPFSNMEIEKELGYLGVEVERQVMLSHWTNSVLMPKFMQEEVSHRDRAFDISQDYIKRIIGGDCVESVGDTIYASKNNIDGVVHLGPFNCLPEIMSQNILPQVSKNEDIPVLSLILDELTGRAGFVTRLEAFVDLICRRKRSKRPIPITAG